MTIEEIDSKSSFVDDKHEDVIIKVIGVGGGGCNAVNHMFEQNIRKVSFVVANTDKQALNNSPVPTRLLLGPQTSKGLGAGNDPEVARQAAEESFDDINRLFDDETQMVFVTAGMGGGTGTGAGPVVARAAQERGLLTIGIVTIPFLFEGKKKITKALKGAEEMSKHVDALLMVNNEQLTEIYPDLDWMNAFGKADDTLANAARSISELITCDGRINLDFKDVNTTLRKGGAAIISTGYGEGENRVTKAIEDALNSPLLKNKDIFGSKRLLFNIYYSPKAEVPFLMGESKELTSFISTIGGNVDIIYGIGFDETLGNKVKITVLAAGFDFSIYGDIDTPAATADTAPRSHNPFKNQRGQEPVPAPEPSTDDQLKHVYGADKIDALNRERASVRYIIMQPSQFDDYEVIEAFEQLPTFNRDKKLADAVRTRQPKDAEAAAPSTASASSTPTPGSPLSDLAAESSSKVIDF